MGWWVGGSEGGAGARKGRLRTRAQPAAAPLSCARAPHPADAGERCFGPHLCGVVWQRAERRNRQGRVLRRRRRCRLLATSAHALPRRRELSSRSWACRRASQLARARVQALRASGRSQTAGLRVGAAAPSGLPTHPCPPLSDLGNARLSLPSGEGAGGCGEGERGIRGPRRRASPPRRTRMALAMRPGPLELSGVLQARAVTTDRGGAVTTPRKLRERRPAGGPACCGMGYPTPRPAGGCAMYFLRERGPYCA
jgi:hypothetical protein